ncbi:MAG: BCCT family transporter [Halomonas sp.]|nr:BCCT family transporter [Halomonas sp.]
MANHGGKSVFIASTLIIFGLVVVGASFPESFGSAAESALATVTELFGWFYLFSVFGFVVFLFGLALSKYGKVRLGPQDSRPNYSFFSWISMLLAAGFGVGLVFYGMAEPMFHYIDPPYGDVNAETEASARYAIQYSYFNWGIHQWAAFSVVGLIIAYFQFRKGQAGLVSSVLSSVTAKHPKIRPYASWLDVFAVVATVMGVATSLGLGVLQMNGGLNAVFGLPENGFWQFVILFVMFCAYMLSTWSGLDKGIKRLSNLNMILCIGLMLYVWIGVFGGAALNMEIVGDDIGLAAATQDNITVALFEMFELMPFSGVLSLIAIMLIFVFLVTSADSASYIVAQMTDNGSINPPLYKRVLWGVLIAAICFTLILAGGLTGLQSAAVLSALPFTFILYMMVIVLVRELRADRKAMLTQLYRRHGETPVGADAFEAEELGEEERLRRAPNVVNRRINH